MAIHSLCWCCGNACNGGCTWSERLEPVEGWTAVEVKGGLTVTECPEFIRDAYGGGIYRNGDEYYRLVSKRLHKMQVNG